MVIQTKIILKKDLKMSKTRLAIIVFLVGVIVLTVLFGLYVWNLQPTPHKCSHATGTGGSKNWLWNSKCTGIQEIFYDSSIKSPGNTKPYLTEFKKGNVTEIGGSIFKPCWYRFRYVNTKTGAYSDFSDWTDYPVMSGSCCLPCFGGPNKCSSSVNPGYNSCQDNYPVIGALSSKIHYKPDISNSNGQYVINLHRYVGDVKNGKNVKPPKTAKTEVVGMLMIPSPDGMFYTWNDILENPCGKKKCSTPSWCLTPKKCNSC